MHTDFIEICNWLYVFLPVELSSAPLPLTFWATTSSTFTSAISGGAGGGSDTTRISLFSSPTHKPEGDGLLFTGVLCADLAPQNLTALGQKESRKFVNPADSTSRVTTFLVSSTSTPWVLGGCGRVTLSTSIILKETIWNTIGSFSDTNCQFVDSYQLLSSSPFNVYGWLLSISVWSALNIANVEWPRALSTVTLRSRACCTTVPFTVSKDSKAQSLST